MKYLMKVEYDGSKFYGFQRLNKCSSVQKTLEDALTKINKTKVVVKGAGRTDRGVHAYGQSVAFDLSINITPDRLKNAINSLIEPYVYVKEIITVDDNFHPRYDCKKKTYKYIINMGEYDCINNDYLYNYNRKLNINNMKKSSKYMLGMNSYEVFTSGERDNYNSIIYNIKFKKVKDKLEITFIGKSFYRYMVRNLVGALILAGENKIKPECIKEMMEKRANIYHYLTVPASGLYLIDVEY